MQKIRIRYAKRGRLAFTSHRDFARALERAMRRAAVPIAYSSGFSPHPKISYASAAPTGVASEAEYFEVGLQAPVEPDWLRGALDAALPPGLDILEAVEATTPDFADRLSGSHWQIRLPEVSDSAAEAAVAAFLAADEIPVQRMTKSGRRTLDARSPVVRLAVTQRGPATGEPLPGSRVAGRLAGGRLGAPSGEVANTTPAPAAEGSDGPCAILDLVVRHVTPSVRPDDVLAGLRVVAELAPPVPPKVIRLAQGTLTGHGEITDPLVVVGADRAVSGTPST